MTIPADVPQVHSTKKGSSRRFSRQLALQLLFQQEFQIQNTPWQETFWDNQSASLEVRAFATRLFQGVIDHQAEIDRLIQAFAVDWSIQRMPVVDRNILRCAIYELLWEPDIPAAVTITEAIELAKRFADDETQRFVNGILDHILRQDDRLTGKRQQGTSTGHPQMSYPKPAS